MNFYQIQYICSSARLSRSAMGKGWNWRLHSPSDFVCCSLAVCQPLGVPEVCKGSRTWSAQISNWVMLTLYTHCCFFLSKGSWWVFEKLPISRDLLSTVALMVPSGPCHLQFPSRLIMFSSYLGFFCPLVSLWGWVALSHAHQCPSARPVRLTRIAFIPPLG